jgi:hypothetical protein
MSLSLDDAFLNRRLTIHEQAIDCGLSLNENPYPFRKSFSPESTNLSQLP